MSRSYLTAVVASSTLLATAGAALAQPSIAAVAPAPERVHSINVSAVGLLGGPGFNLNYERLFGGSHGLVLEAGTDAWAGSSSESVNGMTTSATEIDARHATFGIGYRWHWRGRQNSGFIGAMLHQNVGAADVKVTSGGSETQDEVAYASTTLTVNVGKRWMVTDAFNVTLRLGVGTADRQVIGSGYDPMARAKLEDVIGVPVAVDGELSLGYTF